MFLAFFVLVLLGGLLALLIRVERLSAQFTVLRSRLERLEREKTAAEPRPTRPAVVPAGAVISTPPVAPIPTVVAAPAVPPAPAIAPAPAATRTPAALPPSRTKEEWEALIGGKLLNRIGALALIIGVGFFLKYAFDNNWITETFRVLIGATVGAASLLLAARAEKKGFSVFAQGLVGAGVAILYLSVYAAFNFYHLVPQLSAFLLMAAVTVLAFLQAFRYNAIAVSLLGWVGGFLTPFLLSTGEDNQIGLFSYLLLLDAGVLIVLSKKRGWSVLEPLTIAGTYIIVFSWYNEYYAEPLLATTLVFVGLFWVLFHATDLFFVLHTQENTPPLRRLLSWMNGFLAFWAVLLPLERTPGNPTTVVLVVFAILYALSAVLVLWRKPAERSTAIHYLVGAIAIIAAALFHEFEKFTLPVAWALEAAAVMLLARRLQSRSLGIAGEALLVIAFLTLLTVPGAILYDPIAIFAPVWNGRFGAFLLLLAATACLAILLKRMDRPVEAELFHYGWMIILLIVLSAEINDVFRRLSLDAPDLAAEAAGFRRLMTISVAWAIVGLTFLSLAGRISLRPLLFAGSSVLLIGSALAGVRGIAFVPRELYLPVVNVRFAALLFIGAGGLLATSLLKPLRERNPWASEFRFTLQIIVSVIGAILLTGEIRDTFEKAISTTGAEYQGSSELTRLENLKQLALSGGWLVYSILLMGIGLWRRIRAIRILAIVLFGCTILKIFIYDLSFLETLYRFISFLALGVILLTVSYLYQRYRSIIFEPSRD